LVGSVCSFFFVCHGIVLVIDRVIGFCLRPPGARKLKLKISKLLNFIATTSMIFSPRSFINISLMKTESLARYPLGECVARAVQRFKSRIVLPPIRLHRPSFFVFSYAHLFNAYGSYGDRSLFHLSTTSAERGFWPRQGASFRSCHAGEASG
jgi:hypothetical protein